MRYVSWGSGGGGGGGIQFNSRNRAVGRWPLLTVTVCLFLSIPPAKPKQGQHSIRGSNSRVENSVRHVPQQRTRQSPLVKLCPNQDDGSFFFFAGRRWQL
jgi:hypothetical protein